MTNKTQLITDYRKALTEVDGQLKTLQRRLDNCKALAPTVDDGSIHYSHVGDLNHLATKLKELI